MEQLNVFCSAEPSFVVSLSFQVVLHLWVMIVLLTYTPEMHSRPDGR